MFKALYSSQIEGTVMAHWHTSISTSSGSICTEHIQLQCFYKIHTTGQKAWVQILSDCGHIPPRWTLVSSSRTGLHSERSCSASHKTWAVSPGWGGSIGWALSCKLKGHPGLIPSQGTCLGCGFGPGLGACKKTIPKPHEQSALNELSLMEKYLRGNMPGYNYLWALVA